MFDIGYGELLLIAIVALLVLGPDKLPGALRTAGLWIARFRRSFDRIRSEIEQEVGADDIRRHIHNEMMLDQAREIRREIELAAQGVKDGLQSPLSDLPTSRSAAMERATNAASADNEPHSPTTVATPTDAADSTSPGAATPSPESQRSGGS